MMMMMNAAKCLPIVVITVLETAERMPIVVIIIDMPLTCLAFRVASVVVSDR